MNPRNTLKLAFVAQALTLNIVMPGFVSLAIGIYFIFFFVAVFCGWRWAILYEALNTAIATRNLVSFSAAAVSVPPSFYTMPTQSIFDQFFAWLGTIPFGPEMKLGILIGTLMFCSFYMFVWPWALALSLRERVPSGAWNVPKYKLGSWHGLTILVRRRKK